MTSLLKVHQNLPPGVNPFPTRRGKMRFDLLQVFNAVIAGYVLIHQLLVPVAVYVLQTETQRTAMTLSFWYLYHGLIMLLMMERFRSPRGAYALVYLAWFGVGYLPLALGMTFFDHGVFHLKWKTISGILCYGSSFVFTLALLYRLRMPTTAYLFSLESRIIPKWRYAIPYWVLGLVASLFWLFCPIANRLATIPARGGAEKHEGAGPQNPDDAVARRYRFD